MIYFYLFVFHEKNIMAYTREEAAKWDICVLIYILLFTYEY